MDESLLELVAELVEFNVYQEKKLTLKEFLIQELEYPENEAIEISNLYNSYMMYS